jgi:hypothetical protein
MQPSPCCEVKPSRSSGAFFIAIDKPLEMTLGDHARALVGRRRDPIDHSMLLEDQKVGARDVEAHLGEIVRETNPRLFWD